MSNRIGKRGESIFSTIISRYVPAYGYLLDPVFLGDKFQTIDFYVDLLEYPQKRGFFFASVKTTTQGYYEDNSRLKINVDAQELRELGRFAVPVYLFGIDEVQESGYFLSANHIFTGSNLNGIPTRHPVDINNIRLLWEEVSSFWNTHNQLSAFTSNFQ